MYTAIRIKRLGLGLILLLVLGTLPAFKCVEKKEQKAPEWSTVPDGFVNTPNRRFPFRAIAPDGTTIAVKDVKNEHKGDLNYWAEVFELEMTEGKGYKLTKKPDEITSNDGVTGKLMIFHVAHNETPFEYQLALFVTDKTIITVEAGAEQATIERYNAAFSEVRENLNVGASHHERKKE